jgi:hypothetical protein
VSRSNVRSSTRSNSFLFVPFAEVDRPAAFRAARQRPSLRSSIERSLAQVEHQIWLLRNIFWWYLMPPGAAMTIWLAHFAWQSRTTDCQRWRHLRESL